MVPRSIQTPFWVFLWNDCSAQVHAVLVSALSFCSFLFCLFYEYLLGSISSRLLKFILLLMWTLAGSLQGQGGWDFQPFCGIWGLDVQPHAHYHSAPQSPVCVSQCPLHSVLYWLLLCPPLWLPKALRLSALPWCDWGDSCLCMSSLFSGTRSAPSLFSH